MDQVEESVNLKIKIEKYRKNSVHYEKELANEKKINQPTREFIAAEGQDSDIEINRDQFLDIVKKRSHQVLEDRAKKYLLAKLEVKQLIKLNENLTKELDEKSKELDEI